MDGGTRRDPDATSRVAPAPYATSTYTDAAALDQLLSALSGQAVVLEGHSTGRNTGGATFDWEDPDRGCFDGDSVLSPIVKASNRSGALLMYRITESSTPNSDDHRRKDPGWKGDFVGLHRRTE